VNRSAAERSAADRSLVGRHVAVEVPATIANLGAGYDCLGMAVEMTLVVELEIAAGSTSDGPVIELDVRGEGAAEIEPRRDNRFVAALDAGLAAQGMALPAGAVVRISMTNDIPLERGLGSSGAATVAGLLAADALAGGSEAEPGAKARIDAILAAAARLEGHPDNVAAALLGGIVATFVRDDGQVEWARLGAPEGVLAVLFIPELRLSTKVMREALPPTVPLADAVANLGRVATAIGGRSEGQWGLSYLTEDRLHEPYRAAVYPQLPHLVAAARGAGALGACLAGAGSTILAFADAGNPRASAAIEAAFGRVSDEQNLPGRTAVVAIRQSGGRLIDG
jgi:homoserine kinase